MGLFSKIKQAVSGAGDIVQDTWDTAKDTAQGVVDYAKNNPIKAAALIGAGYYFAPEIGAWFNSSTGQAIANGTV